VARKQRRDSSGADQAVSSAAQQQGLADTSEPSTECIDYRRMTADWQLIHDLMGGTKTMRSAGSRWLPQEPKEDIASYLVRLNRSTFFNAYKRAVSSLAGRPFSKPITYPEDLDEQIQSYILDVDLNGRHMDVFLRDVFQAALADGMRHVLIDKAGKPEEEKTAADEKRFGRRPYCVEIDPRNMIFWEYTYVFGHPFLTQVRIKETVTEPVGDWGQREKVQYRVLKPGSFEVWEKHDDRGTKGEQNGPMDKWEKTQEGTTDLNYIPLVTVYTGRVGFMISEPPLIDLAWENVHHWQSRSDQNHILHIARVPVWFGRGMPNVTAEGTKIEYTVSPNAMIVSNSDNADLKIVEHTGKAIEAGANDLKDCETRMAVLGTELLTGSRGTALKTATEVDVEAMAQYSSLTMMVRGLEDAAESIIEIMGDWEGIAMPDDEFVSISKEFTVAGHIEMMGEITKMRGGGDLSRYTYLSEAKRFGALSPTVNVDEEMERISLEGPDLSDLPPALYSEPDTQFSGGPKQPKPAGTPKPGAAAAPPAPVAIPVPVPVGKRANGNGGAGKDKSKKKGKRVRPSERYAGFQDRAGVGRKQPTVQ
jgi:Domain of unknown function (DUF4055)